MTENIVKPLKLPDGYSVETVYYGSGTLCISSQAGCRMACPFCASGRAGLIRNLSLHEFQEQVYLHAETDVKRITMSGIGEPLDNIETVERFISEASLPVSLTTSVPSAELLRKAFNLPHNGIMLSLHAGFEVTHKKLIPKSIPLDEVFSSLSDTWQDLSGNRKRKTGFNYLLFQGVNDTDDEIAAFIRRVKPFKEATVHLLVCNHVERSSFTSPDSEKFEKVYRLMRDAGLNVRRASHWRKEAKGGCGTLFLKSLQK